VGPPSLVPPLFVDQRRRSPSLDSQNAENLSVISGSTSFHCLPTPIERQQSFSSNIDEINYTWASEYIDMLKESDKIIAAIPSVQFPDDEQKEGDSAEGSLHSNRNLQNKEEMSAPMDEENESETDFIEIDSSNPLNLGMIRSNTNSSLGVYSGIPSFSSLLQDENLSPLTVQLNEQQQQLLLQQESMIPCASSGRKTTPPSMLNPINTLPDQAIARENKENYSPLGFLSPVRSPFFQSRTPLQPIEEQLPSGVSSRSGEETVEFEELEPETQSISQSMIVSNNDHCDSGMNSNSSAEKDNNNRSGSLFSKGESSSLLNEGFVESRIDFLLDRTNRTSESSPKQEQHRMDEKEPMSSLLPKRTNSSFELEPRSLNIQPILPPSIHSHHHTKASDYESIEKMVLKSSQNSVGRGSPKKFLRTSSPPGTTMEMAMVMNCDGSDQFIESQYKTLSVPIPAAPALPDSDDETVFPPRVPTTEQQEEDEEEEQEEGEDNDDDNDNDTARLDEASSIIEMNDESIHMLTDHPMIMSMSNQQFSFEGFKENEKQLSDLWKGFDEFEGSLKQKTQTTVALQQQQQLQQQDHTHPNYLNRLVDLKKTLTPTSSDYSLKSSLPPLNPSSSTSSLSRYNSFPTSLLNHNNNPHLQSISVGELFFLSFLRLFLPLILFSILLCICLERSSTSYTSSMDELGVFNTMPTRAFFYLNETQKSHPDNNNNNMDNSSESEAHRVFLVQRGNREAVRSDIKQLCVFVFSKFAISILG
jgi:hypothetical protein